MKLFAFIISLAALSIVGTLYAQPGGYYHGGGGDHDGDHRGGYGYGYDNDHRGGYYGGGNYGGYNNNGYAVAPYRGCATGPVGYAGFSVNFGGPGYGGYYNQPGGYAGPGGGYGNRCSWDNYYHQWRCW